MNLYNTTDDKQTGVKHSPLPDNFYNVMQFFDGVSYHTATGELVSMSNQEWNLNLIKWGVIRT